MFEFAFGIEKGKARKILEKDFSYYLKKKRFVWLHYAEANKNDLAFLNKKFKLSIDEKKLKEKEEISKISESGKGINLTLINMIYTKGILKQNLENFFLGKHFLISISEKPSETLNEILDQALKGKTHDFLSSQFLLYKIIKRLFNSYIDFLDEVDDEFDEIAEKMFKSTNVKMLNSLFNLKKVLLDFKKVNSSTRDSLVFLTDRSDFISESNQGHYKELYNINLRIREMIETLKDLSSTILDGYVSLVSNKLNEIMKFLTIFSTIILPMTLITGIYGMNFKYMPELESPYGYFFALGILALIAGTMFYYFKSRKWI